MAKFQGQALPAVLRLNGYLTLILLIDTTTNEKSWNVWMGDGWSINLGRMLVDGEKMRTEAANPWDTNQKHTTYGL